MSATEIELLKHLLQQHREISAVQRCLATLTEGRSHFVTGTGPVPTKNLCDIYTVRARWKQEIQDTIEGYETLLPALATTMEENLHLHDVIAPEEWFLIFADPTTTQWIGMLSKKSDRAYHYHRQHSVTEGD